MVKKKTGGFVRLLNQLDNLKKIDDDDIYSLLRNFERQQVALPQQSSLLTRLQPVGKLSSLAQASSMCQQRVCVHLSPKSAPKSYSRCSDIPLS